jgi:hypothetical protein
VSIEEPARDEAHEHVLGASGSTTDALGLIDRDNDYGVHHGLVVVDDVVLPHHDVLEIVYVVHEMEDDVVLGERDVHETEYEMHNSERLGDETEDENDEAQQDVVCSEDDVHEIFVAMHCSEDHVHEAFKGVVLFD